MESFNEIIKKKQKQGIGFLGADGKRIMKGTLENLRTLANTKVTILDFEPDVPTKNGPRYVVQFKKADVSIGKYFTNDSEQKFWLEELRKDKSLPFECTISPQFFGQGKVRYMFT